MTKKMISWLSVLTVFLTLLGACRQEDLLLKEEKNNQKVLSSKILHYQDLEKRKAVFGELMKLTKDSHNSKTARTYTDQENGFSVELEDVMYTEDPFGGKTYTFKITRDTPKANLENLVMVEQKDGLLETFIFEYDKEVELNYFSSSLELKNSLMEHVTITNLGTRKSIGQNAKMLYDCDNIIATWVETPGTTCPDGNYNHTFEDGDACVYWGTVDMALPAYGGHYEYTFQIGNCGGGASTGNGTTGTTGPYHGGGSGTGTILNTPCAKIKSIVNNPQLKPKIDSLKKHSLTAVKDEEGYHQDKSGNVTPAAVNGAHHVDFIIDQNSLGGIHSHTLNGTHMFTPPDILTLIRFARVQNYTLPVGSIADNTGNGFLGMIAQSGSYFITFNGGSGDLPPPMTQAEEEAFELEMNETYKKNVKKLLKAEGKNMSDDLSEIGLQKLFFDMIKTMGLEGKINLIKENSGNTSTIQQNSDGTIKAPIPC